MFSFSLSRSRVLPSFPSPLLPFPFFPPPFFPSPSSLPPSSLPLLPSLFLPSLPVLPSLPPSFCRFCSTDASAVAAVGAATVPRGSWPLVRNGLAVCAMAGVSRGVPGGHLRHRRGPRPVLSLPAWHVRECRRVDGLPDMRPRLYHVATQRNIAGRSD